MASHKFKTIKKDNRPEAIAQINSTVIKQREALLDTMRLTLQQLHRMPIPDNAEHPLNVAIKFLFEGIENVTGIDESVEGPQL